MTSSHQRARHSEAEREKERHRHRHRHRHTRARAHTHTASLARLLSLLLACSLSCSLALSLTARCCVSARRERRQGNGGVVGPGAYALSSFLFLFLSLPLSSSLFLSLSLSLSLSASDCVPQVIAEWVARGTSCVALNQRLQAARYPPWPTTHTSPSLPAFSACLLCLPAWLIRLCVCRTSTPEERESLQIFFTSFTSRFAQMIGLFDVEWPGEPPHSQTTHAGEQQTYGTVVAFEQQAALALP